MKREGNDEMIRKGREFGDEKIMKKRRMKTKLSNNENQTEEEKWMKSQKTKGNRKRNNDEEEEKNRKHPNTHNSSKLFTNNNTNIPILLLPVGMITNFVHFTKHEIFIHEKSTKSNHIQHSNPSPPQ